MSTRNWLNLRGVNILCRTGYLVAAGVVLVPLAPVVILMWLARWLDKNEAQHEREMFGRLGSSAPCRSKAGTYRTRHCPPTMTPIAHVSHGGLKWTPHRCPVDHKTCDRLVQLLQV